MQKQASKCLNLTHKLSLAYVKDATAALVKQGKMQARSTPQRQCHGLGSACSISVCRYIHTEDTLHAGVWQGAAIQAALQFHFADPVLFCHVKGCYSIHTENTLHAGVWNGDATQPALQFQVADPVFNCHAKISDGLTR